MFLLEYIIAVKNIVFSTSEKDLSDILEMYTKKTPEPLSAQFRNRRSKEDAVTQHKGGQTLDSHALFPSCEYHVV